MRTQILTSLMNGVPYLKEITIISMHKFYRVNTWQHRKSFQSYLIELYSTACTATS